MTTLHDAAVGPASQNDCPARLLLLALSEPRAPITILSPAKRNALVACFNAGGSTRKTELGMGYRVASQYPA
jgi:hypothetical protein